MNKMEFADRDRAMIILFTLSTIVRNYISVKKSVYCAFIDFKKTFDCINKALLVYRLLRYNIDGKMLAAIRSLYTGTKSCIKLNDNITDYFDVKYGVKQGCNICPQPYFHFLLMT